MRKTKRATDMSEWVTAHRRFHTLCTAPAGVPLAGIILSYSERTERYVRFGQQAHADTFAVAEAEHEQILTAVVNGEVDAAGSLMARHLAHTAATVLGDLDPNFEAVTMSESLQMCAGGPL